MNGAVSRARLGINRWLARDPLFGYYFRPAWGTIPLVARPEKPQFSLGWIFSESSNPSSSTASPEGSLLTQSHPRHRAATVAMKPFGRRHFFGPERLR